MNDRAFGPRAKTTSCVRPLAALPFVLFVMTACIGTTGSDLVTFKAFASGPPEVPADTPVRGLSFVAGPEREWSITLTRAKLHIGAVYLNRSVPVSGGQERECFLPGVYVAQVLSGMTVDALSPELQPFPETGTGTADHAVTAEVWLTGRRIDAQEDPTVIADFAGTATKHGQTMRFEGTITIGANRRNRDIDPARPGAKPLCAERIVTPIATSITPTNGGSLVVRVDPRAWFANVDFDELAASPGTDVRRIPDSSEGQPATSLYNGLRSASSNAYRFEWMP